MYLKGSNMVIKTEFEPNEELSLDNLYADNRLMILPAPIGSTIYQIVFNKAKDKIWQIHIINYIFKPYNLDPYLFFDIMRRFNITFFKSEKDANEACETYNMNPKILIDKLNATIM